MENNNNKNNVVYKHKISGTFIDHSTLLHYLKTGSTEITIQHYGFMTDEILKYTYKIKEIPFSEDFEVETFSNLTDEQINDILGCLYTNRFTPGIENRINDLITYFHNEYATRMKRRGGRF